MIRRVLNLIKAKKRKMGEIIRRKMDKSMEKEGKCKSILGFRKG